MKTISSNEFRSHQIARHWKALRADAIAALGLPSDAQVRIANNAVTLYADIDGQWFPVMKGSLAAMKDWAWGRDYTLRLSITV